MAYGSAMVVSSQRDDVHALHSLVDAILEFHVSFRCPDTEETLGRRLRTRRAWIGAQILKQIFHIDTLLRIEQPLLPRHVVCHEDTVSMVSSCGACHDGIAPLPRDRNRSICAACSTTAAGITTGSPAP